MYMVGDIFVQCGDTFYDVHIFWEQHILIGTLLHMCGKVGDI